MMQQPPPPPGFVPVGSGPSQAAQASAMPPPPPGFVPMQAQQAPNPARAAPSRPAIGGGSVGGGNSPSYDGGNSVSYGGAGASPVAPAPFQPRTNDLGITDDEELASLIRQGYSPEQARAMVAQPETANYGVVDRQDLEPTDTPESLRAQGYEIDPKSNVWARTVGTIERNTPSLSPGYQLARQQEEARSKLLRESGVGMNATDFTTPLNDEMAGLAGYLAQGAGNLGRRLMGRNIEVSASERGHAAYDTYSNDQEKFQREHPGQAALGSIAGGFAMAPARAVGAAGAAQNFMRTSQAFARPTVAQGYIGAGAAGTAYGASDAEGGLMGRGAGAVTGGLGALATMGVLDGAGSILGSLSTRGGPRLSGPQARVGQALDRELRANRINPNDLLSSMNGAPAGSLPLNAQDGVLAPVAEALVASTGPGGRIVRQAVDAQRGAAPDRIMSRIGNEIGGEGNYFATLNSSIEQRRQAAGQVIDQIGPQQFRLDANAVRSLRSDLAQPQIRQAAQNALASPDQATYEMGANLMRLADTVRDNPSAAVLDVRTAQDVSKALLDLSRDAWRRGDGSTGQALGGIGRAVRNNAREAVPEYGQWLQRYGDESSQIDALELGRRVFRNADDPAADGMSAEVLRDQLAEMSDTAKDMFRKGIAEAIVARARTSRGEVGAMRDLLRTREFGDRVRLAFPDEQAFTRFMNAAESEVAMANAGQSITGNSSTARRQATMQRLGGQPEQQAVDQLSQTTLTGIPLALGRAGLRAGGRALGKSRSVLQNDDLNELLGRALTDQDVLRAMLQGRPVRRGLFSGRAPAGVAGAIPQAVPGF